MRLLKGGKIFILVMVVVFTILFTRTKTTMGDIDTLMSSIQQAESINVIYIEEISSTIQDVYEHEYYKHPLSLMKSTVKIPETEFKFSIVEKIKGEEIKFEYIRMRGGYRTNGEFISMVRNSVGEPNCKIISGVTKEITSEYNLLEVGQYYLMPFNNFSISSSVSHRYLKLDNYDSSISFKKQDELVKSYFKLHQYEYNL